MVRNSSDFWKHFIVSSTGNIKLFFADNTEMDNAKHLQEFDELQKSINDHLSCLKTYFDDNRLSVNVDKYEFMLLGTYQALWKIPSPQIHINNKSLRQVSVAKYLGMYIDENLHWDHHIDTLVKKISSKTGILRSLRNIYCVWCSLWDRSI